MGDPALKLFGKTIPLMDSVSCSGSDPDPIVDPASQDKFQEINSSEDKEMEAGGPIELDQVDQNNLSSLNITQESDQQTSSQNTTEKSDSKPEQDQPDSADASGQEKVLKKPDKILPCPRCNSVDTKFCYYNNYNVNQPRHFCKNCQRYWTAGGTMRNVPVGAGRRKNKHSASQYRHIMISPETAIDPSHHYPLSLKPNGTVLKFGRETPLCESMSSVLNLNEQKRKTELSTNEEPSCASSLTASCCVENGIPENASQNDQNNMHGYCSNGVTPMHPLQYYPGPPWAYPWSIPPILAAPAFCTPTIPVPFIPAPFWPAGPWNVPWTTATNGGVSPSSSTSNNSGNNSPTLGKHCRDTSLLLQGEEKTEKKSLWVPKTLRIDDPDEAAKSSIWATLGIKPDDGGMFKTFQSKAKSKGQKSDTSPLLLANPAALSRSQSFHEGA